MGTGEQHQTGFLAESCLWFCRVKCARASAEAPVKTVKSLADSCLPRVRRRGPCLHVELKKKKKRRGPNYLVTSVSRWRQLGNGPNELIAFGLGHNERELHLKENAAARPLLPQPLLPIPTFSSRRSPPSPNNDPLLSSPRSSITRRSCEVRTAMSASIPSFRGSRKTSHLELWRLSRGSPGPDPLPGVGAGLLPADCSAPGPSLGCGKALGTPALPSPRGRGCCGSLRLHSAEIERAARRSLPGCRMRFLGYHPFLQPRFSWVSPKHPYSRGAGIKKTQTGRRVGERAALWGDGRGAFPRAHPSPSMCPFRWLHS